MRERTSYTPDASDKFDHLNDYFAPRYRHAYTGDDVLPGGGIYTRVQGEYPVDGGREREAYIRSLTENPGRVYGEVYTADDAGIRTLAGRRLAYTGCAARRSKGCCAKPETAPPVRITASARSMPPTVWRR